ncbi:MAG: NUDIX hydrolase [Bacteroidia bacterium]
MRIYHKENCLELLTLTSLDGGLQLPSTGELKRPMSGKYLYLPGTDEKIYNYHTQYESLAIHWTIYFPSLYAQEQWFQSYQRYFSYLQAAGGVVIDEKGKVLFLWRRGHWDLPKGKIEKGEDPLLAAQREISEETGIGKLTFLDTLSPTYHIYTEKDKRYMKKTSWYLFRASSEEILIPQKEEGIESIHWFSPEAIPHLYSRSYGTVRDVIEELIARGYVAANRR